MGDRIAILDAGELQQVATPLEAYHRPANRFVAGFIGEPSMNFIECRIDRDALVADGFTYPVDDAVATAVADSTTVTLGIRPEDITLDVTDERDAAAGGDHTFAARIDVVEPMGDENVVHLSIDDGHELVATVDGLRRVEAGSTVSVTIPQNAIHVFDSDSGEALHSRSLDDAELDRTRV